MFNMPLNYEKVGIIKSDNVYLQRDKIIEYFSDDIKNALLAFAELAKILGSQLQLVISHNQP